MKNFSKIRKLLIKILEKFEINLRRNFEVFERFLGIKSMKKIIKIIT